MNPPRYGHGDARSRLCEAFAELQPLPSSVCVLFDVHATAARGPLVTALEELDAPLHFVEWEAGESRKTLAEVEAFAREFVRRGVDRRSVVLAVGGGTTTDLGGFLAAVLLRGLRWGAIPTTLLGMVDAAVGGKTAVDLPEGKNLVGAFHMPEFVVGDVDFLASLPEREWSCGLGEVLKTALLGDAALLSGLETAPAAELRRPGEVALGLALDCAALKTAIVEEDPFEHGRRKMLNLGHTFGHALETGGGHAVLAHGEAIALGLLCAVRMAEEMGVARKGIGARMRARVPKLGLPARFPGALPAEAELVRLLRRDKKADSGLLDLILPVEPGECLLLKGIEPAVAAVVIQRELGG
ncbi:MAG TPA: 3-dehydroquinate synthase family protein [Planctomycetota bacterium]